MKSTQKYKPQEMKEKICATIDTNVLVSSLFSINGSSNPARVIRAVIEGTITPLYNDEIIQEYRDVLSRDKFKFNPRHIDALIAMFTEFGIKAKRVNATGEVFPDADDIVFYEITMSVEDAYLVTGNTRHYPPKAFVVTPAQMIDILKEKGLL